MTEQHHISQLIPEQQAVERIEFSPVRMSRLAGFIGKMGVGGRNGEAYQSPQPGQELGQLINHYQGMGEVPELNTWPDSEHRGDIDHDAKPLLEAMWASPILEKPVFLNNVRSGGRAPVCKIKADEWANLRVRNFIHAPGVSNWNEGNSSKKSKQIIRRYARSEANLEPIDLVSAYVQPNGVILYSVVRDGSHRLSAAHLRNEKSIPVNKSISVYTLPNNVIPLTQTRLP